MDKMQLISTRLGIVANRIKSKRPELALALTLINDRLSQIAMVPPAMVSFHNRYQKAGGEKKLEGFLGSIPMFLRYRKIDAEDILKWEEAH